MWDSSAITNTGIGVISRWISGERLTITRAKLGKATVAQANIKSLTNVTSYAKDAPIIGHKVVNNGVQYAVRITPDSTAFTVKQVCLFGRIGDEAETLIAVYQDTNGVSVPSTADNSEFVYDFYAVVASGTGDSLTVTVDSSVYATAAELQSVSESIGRINTSLAGKQDSLTASGGVKIEGNVVSAKKIHTAYNVTSVRSGNYTTVFIDYTSAGFTEVQHVSVSVTSPNRYSKNDTLSKGILELSQPHIYNISINGCCVDFFNGSQYDLSFGVSAIVVGD